MWAGTISSIPNGWALCDGNKGTPDLSDRFIVGSSQGANPGQKGGASSYKLTVNQLPSHSHSGSTNSTGIHSHSGTTSTAGNHTHEYLWRDWAYRDETTLPGLVYGSPRYHPPMPDKSTTSAGSHSHSFGTNSTGSHAHSFTTDATGSGTSIDNRPAYYALAFIMKL